MAVSHTSGFSRSCIYLPRLCAPFRDEEVKSLVNNSLWEGDVVDRLEALNAIIDLMQSICNFMLQQSAPELIKHAISYEQKRFVDVLTRVSTPSILWNNGGEHQGVKFLLRLRGET